MPVPGSLCIVSPNLLEKEPLLSPPRELFPTPPVLVVAEVDSIGESFLYTEHFNFSIVPQACNLIP